MNVVLDGEILGPGLEEERARRLKRDFWKSLKRVAREIPFIEEVVAAYYCAVDSQTPPRVRTILLTALASFLLPLGPATRVLAWVGLGERTSVVALAITTVYAHITPAHRAAAKSLLASW
jgi:uncharacterized membrane protein YkvA (DUF1232 family)